MQQSGIYLFVIYALLVLVLWNTDQVNWDLSCSHWMELKQTQLAGGNLSSKSFPFFPKFVIMITVAWNSALLKIAKLLKQKGAGLVQWLAKCWEHLPATNVVWVWLWPSVICELSLLLILSLLQGLFPGFPSSTKTNISKFQFDQDRGPVWKTTTADEASSLNIVYLLNK